VDFRSETFQKAYKDLISIPNLNQDIAVSYLKEKNIDPVEFKIANKNFSDFKLSGKEVRPEGFALGRIAGRMLGEAGEDIKDIGTMIAPKTTEAISQFVSDIIPDAAEDYMDRMFDPYMGEGTGSEVSRVTADIGSFFLPGKAIKYGVKGGKAIVGGKQATAIGPKAQQTKKFKDRLEDYGSYATGYTIAEDSADENTYNAMLDLADQYGGLKGTEVSSLLRQFAINPDDSEVVQKLNSLALNLSGVGMFAGLAKLKTPMDRAKALELIKKKKDKAAKSSLKIDVLPTTWLGKAADKVKIPFTDRSLRSNLYRGLSTTRGTDKFTRDRILKREAAEKRVLKEVDGMGQSLVKAIDNAVQTGKVTKEEAEELVNNILSRDMKSLRELQNIAPEVARLAVTMANNIKRARIPVAGNIKGGSKLKAVYDPVKNKVWLNRSYRIYDDPSFSRNIKDIDEKIIANVQHYLKTKLGIPENKLAEATEELLQRGNMEEKTLLEVFNPFKTGTASSGRSSSKAYMKKTELAKVPEIRALWGEIKDPYKNYKNSMEKLAKMESEASFLEDMAKYLKENGLAKTADEMKNRSGPIIGDFADFVPLTVTKEGADAKIGKEGEDFATATLRKVFGERNVEGYKKPVTKKLKDKEGKPLLDKKGQQKVKEINVPVKPSILNPLEGLYVNKNYRDFLNEGTDILSPQSSIMKNWMRYKVATQTSKTIYNPSTHGRNTLGNKIFLVANGMNPFSYKKEGFKSAAEKLTGRSNKDLGKRLGRYQELGITDSGVKQEIIRRAANQVFKFEEKTIAAKVQKAMNAKENPLKAVQNLYQVEDDFFKIMHFENTIDKLKKVFPKGTPIEVIEEEAARRTRDLMPNYNLVGKTLKKARFLPVGDFMAFPAETLRVSKNLFRDTVDDITGKTAARLEYETGKKFSRAQKQELKNIGYKRLGGMTAAATAGDQAMDWSANMMGITGEDKTALERLQPKWEKGTSKIFLSNINKDNNNHWGIDYINMGPIDPFSYFKTPVKLVAAELANYAQTGKLSVDADQRFNAAARQFLGAYGGTSMSTEALMKFFNSSKEFGKAAAGTKTFEQAVDTFLKGVQAVGESIMPGIATMYLKGQKYRTSKELRKGLYNPVTGEYGRGAVSDYDYTIPEVEMEALGGIPRWFGIRPQRLDITAGLYRNIVPKINEMKKKTNQKNFTSDPNAPRDIEERRVGFINAYKKDQRNNLNQQRQLKKLVDAYAELGLDYEDIISGLTREYTREGVNIEDIVEKLNYARLNKFIPSPVADTGIAEAQFYTGGALPLAEIGNIYNQLFQYNLVDED